MLQLQALPRLLPASGYWLIGSTRQQYTRADDTLFIYCHTFGLDSRDTLSHHSRLWLWCFILYLSYVSHHIIIASAECVEKLPEVLLLIHLWYYIKSYIIILKFPFRLLISKQTHSWCNFIPMIALQRFAYHVQMGFQPAPRLVSLVGNLALSTESGRPPLTREWHVPRITTSIQHPLIIHLSCSPILLLPLAHSPREEMLNVNNIPQHWNEMKISRLHNIIFLFLFLNVGQIYKYPQL